MSTTDRNKKCKLMFTKIEEKLFEDPKDSSFYYHSSEDRMVLSQDRTYVANTSKMAIEK